MAGWASPRRKDVMGVTTKLDESGDDIAGWRCPVCGTEYTQDVGECGQLQPFDCDGFVEPIPPDDSGGVIRRFECSNCGAGEHLVHRHDCKVDAPLRTYVEVNDAVDRVTAALWESLPIGCSEHELRMIVARGIAGSLHA